MAKYFHKFAIDINGRAILTNHAIFVKVDRNSPIEQYLTLSKFDLRSQINVTFIITHKIPQRVPATSPL